MKIIKYIFLLLILSAVALAVFIATQSGKYTITRYKIINAPKETLYGYVNDYQNWQNLDLLKDADTTAIYNYSENTAGAGAAMQWQKNNTSGSVKTLKAYPADSIVQDATVNGLGSTIKWAFKDTVGGTKITVSIQGELSFYEKAQALLSNEKINTAYKKSATKGLENIETYLVNDLKKYEATVAGYVKKKGTFYLGHTTTTLRADITKTALTTFKGLADFTAKNKIITTGEPFIVFKNYSRHRDTLTYTLCIPIKDEMFTSPGSEYEGGRLQAFNALKTTLKGDYAHLPQAWKAADKYIAEKKLNENTALPYVIYFTKNSRQSRRPSQWITDVYVPIGPALPENTTPVPADSLQTITPQTAVPATQTPPAEKPKTQKQKNTTKTPSAQRKNVPVVLPRTQQKDSVKF